MEKSSKKWSLGVLFRKNKKDIPQADFSSDEDDRKAGFDPMSLNKSPPKGKSNRQLVENFDQKQYSVANPEFHYYKPTHIIEQPRFDYDKKLYVNQQNMEVMKNQINLEKNRLAQPQPQYINNQGSSQDEKSSYNSLSPSKTGSDSSYKRRSRAARNERYYQRMMRDDGRPLTIYGSVNSIENYSHQYNGNQNNYTSQYNSQQNRLSTSLKSSSLCSADFNNLNYPLLRNFDPQKQQLENRDDYENIHTIDDSTPPPIPPRDPNRRLSINSSIMKNPYYFDHNLQKYVVFSSTGKCYSDDRLWKHDGDLHNAQKIPIQPQKTSFKRPLSSIKLDHYSNDQQKSNDIMKPRSRKPINVTNLDKATVFDSEDVVDNGRIEKRSKSALDFPKLMRDVVPARKQESKFTQIVQQQVASPNSFCGEELLALRKKYSSADDINKKFVGQITNCNSNNNQLKPKPKINESIASNLDDAINELESMYVHLMNDEELIDRASKRDNTMVGKFEVLAKTYDDFENEENNEVEPDIVKDDVFSRNIKRANQSIKVVDQQPPFGIPIGPIPPKPTIDYLSVEPAQIRKQVPTKNNPDVIADDLAVRNLRKDNPVTRNQYIQMDNNHYAKRNHTLSSISDDIYNEILKNSTKPSGGKGGNTNISTEKDIQSSLVKDQSPNNSDRQGFEETLDNLVIESKLISKKLEKDLSKLKRESLTPTRRTMMQILLDNAKKPAVEKKSTSCSPIQFAPQKKEIDKQKEKMEKQKASPPSPISLPKATKETACSPIDDLQISATDSLKSPKSEKIGNLIEMFNNNDIVVKKSTDKFERPAKRPLISPVNVINSNSKDEPNMAPQTIPSLKSRQTSPFSRSVLSPVKSSPVARSLMSPLSQIVKPTVSPVTATKSQLRSITSPIKQCTVESPDNLVSNQTAFSKPCIVSSITIIPKRNVFSPAKSPLKTSVSSSPPFKSTENSIITPVVPLMIHEEKQIIVPVEDEKPIDIESNINNIKELIQQIKATDFETNAKIKFLKKEIPDYDNIQNDYAMFNGKLERICKSEDEEKNQLESSAAEDDESSVRETSREFSKESTEELLSTDESVIINNNPIKYLNGKSPQKDVDKEEKTKMKQDEETNKKIEKVTVGDVKPNKSDESEKSSSEEIPKFINVKEKINQLENKICSRRQDIELVAAQPNPQTCEIQQQPKIISPVLLPPKINSISDTDESQYNSTEELSMIFGISEPQVISSHSRTSTSPTPKKGKLNVTECNKESHDFDIVDEDNVNELFDLALTEINNAGNNEFGLDWFDTLVDPPVDRTESIEPKIDSEINTKADNSSTASTSEPFPSSSGTSNSLISGKSPLSQAISNYETQCSKRLLRNQPNRCTNNHKQNPSNSNIFESNSDFIKTRCILLACTYCITNNDLFTVLVIIIAILTLISVLVL